MTISQAIAAVSAEYDEECRKAQTVAGFDAMMCVTIADEYDEIDRELPSYVVDIASAKGVPGGTVLPDYVYQMARMCFRLGMRVQRKLDQPERVTTTFWQSGVLQ
jgi:hypothetical protein